MNNIIIFVDTKKQVLEFTKTSAKTRHGFSDFFLKMLDIDMHHVEHLYTVYIQAS